jgi:hypothetical protein
MEQRNQDIQMAEAMSRLKEAAAFHDATIAARNRSTDVRQQYDQGRIGLGVGNEALRRQQLSQQVTSALAAKGFKPSWDADGNFTGVVPMSKEELSPIQQSGIDLNSAREQFMKDRTHQAQAELLYRHAHDMVIHNDRRFALAYKNAGEENKAEFDADMHNLISEHLFETKSGYPNYGGDQQKGEADYLEKYNDAKRAFEEKNLKLNTGAGPAPHLPSASNSPTAGQRIRVRDKATGQTGTILGKDFDGSKYERLQ